jgi:hypothetical protein
MLHKWEVATWHLTPSWNSIYKPTFIRLFRYYQPSYSNNIIALFTQVLQLETNSVVVCYENAILWHWNIVPVREGGQFKNDTYEHKNFVAKVKSVVTLILCCHICQSKLDLHLLRDQQQSLLLFDETLKYGNEWWISSSQKLWLKFTTIALLLF